MRRFFAALRYALKDEQPPKFRFSDFHFPITSKPLAIGHQPLANLVLQLSNFGFSINQQQTEAVIMREKAGNGKFKQQQQIAFDRNDLLIAGASGFSWCIWFPLTIHRSLINQSLIHHSLIDHQDYLPPTPLQRGTFKLFWLFSFDLRLTFE